MTKFRALALLLLVPLVACTPRELRAWVAWHDQDPEAAVAFAQQPEVVADLATGEHEQQAPSGGGGGTPGVCDTYADDMAAVGLPVATFTRIAWRETGCNPNVWVVNRTDTGGAMFGFNLKGSLAGYWRNLCGATTSNLRGNVPLIMECAAAEYHAHGLRAWS